MIIFFIFCTLLATAYSAKRQDHSYYRHHSVSKSLTLPAEIKAELLSGAPNIHFYGFDYHLESSNGITSKTSDYKKGSINGNFQWKSPEGDHFTASYVADENDYHPIRHLLSTSTPISEATLKSYLSKKKEHYQYKYDHNNYYDHNHHDHHHNLDSRVF